MTACFFFFILFFFFNLDLLLFRKLDDDVKFTDGEFYTGADFFQNRFLSHSLSRFPKARFPKFLLVYFTRRIDLIAGRDT